MATDVTAFVTGAVLRIEHRVGDAVQAGDVLVVLEAMKMEIPVEAPVAGSIATLAVREGDSVLEGDLIATLE